MGVSGGRRGVPPAALAIGAAAVIVGVFVVLPPIRQDAGFHLFADRRTLLGLPNALDVLSNFPLALAGLLGLRATLGRGAVFADPWERVPWTVLFAAVVATAAGSAAYHVVRDTTTLLWDRLPQTAITMALVAAVVAERGSVTAGRRALWPLVILGAVSIVVWRATGDLRLYGVVQFLPTVVLPLLLLANPPRYSRVGLLWVALGWYVVARLCEMLDYEIYAAAGISGHTLKHVAAAASVLWLWRLLGERELLPAGLRRSGSGSPSG